MKAGSNIKMGICRKGVNTEQAFCDVNDGYGIYNGQLRHGSNSSGQKYGSKPVVGDIVGLLVDTENGTLSFSRNGEEMGVAYKTDEIKKG
mmetsp:Transcript_14578/g.19802  ORF Transcript_14578/g.19802 Transcript_14578/m.19802 type:complete len:90 (-) Transcript_14578:107-376(-)